jgi:ABC-type sugar transport system substrate-binding protein
MRRIPRLSSLTIISYYTVIGKGQLRSNSADERPGVSRFYGPSRRIAVLLAGTCATYLIIGQALTGCERATPDRRGKPGTLQGVLIAVVGPSEGHSRWPGIRGGAQRFIASVPAVQATCVAPREENADALRTTVDRVLESHPNVICLFVADAQTARPSIARITASQCTLVIMGECISDVPVAGQVGVDLPGTAELLGESLTRVAAGRRSYLLLHDEGRSEVDTNCYHRFTAAAQKQYGLTLLQAANAAQGGYGPARLVEDLLGSFTHAGLLVTLDPDVWLAARPGWYRRLRELNGEFRFATLSAAPALWPHLGTPHAPGEAAALVGPLDGEIGYAAVQLATQLLISTERVSPKITIPCELVTPDNLADFAQRYSAAANRLDISAYFPDSTRTIRPDMRK